MEKFNENAVQDPRGSESSVKPNEQEIDQDQKHRHPEEQEQRAPTAMPDADNGDTVNPLQEPDSESSGFKNENLIPVKNANQEDPDERDEDEEDEEEMDEEEDEMEDDDKDRDTEPGRDTARSQSGDDFSSPASYADTNFEDPVRDRKTDPMTDHEPRIAGI